MVQEITQEYGSKVVCPHLLIKGTDSQRYMADENYDRLLKNFRNNNPKVAAEDQQTSMTSEIFPVLLPGD